MHLNNSHNPLRPKKDRNFDPFSSKELWVLLFRTLYGLPLYQISANKRNSALRTRNEIKTNIKLSNLFKIATSSHASPLPNVSLSYRVGYISHVMSIIPCNEHRSDFHASKFLFLIIWQTLLKSNVLPPPPPGNVSTNYYKVDSKFKR